MGARLGPGDASVIRQLLGAADPRLGPPQSESTGFRLPAPLVLQLSYQMSESLLRIQLLRQTSGETPLTSSREPASDSRGRTLTWVCAAEGQEQQNMLNSQAAIVCVECRTKKC